MVESLFLDVCIDLGQTWAVTSLIAQVDWGIEFFGHQNDFLGLLKGISQWLLDEDWFLVRNDLL